MAEIEKRQMLIVHYLDGMAQTHDKIGELRYELGKIDQQLEEES